MCGIVGYIGTQPAVSILLEGLRKLEYRGYDSAGIATVWEGQLHTVRAQGKLYNLQAKLEGWEMPARLGIGHTRWATHGKPEERNAHPHMDPTQTIAVVQNGIIENYRELKELLIAEGASFSSETDTEVVPHLIARCWRELAQESASGWLSGSRLMEATRRAIGQLKGAFALAIVAADAPDELIVVRQQAPISIGFGQGEFFCASDTPAIVPYTRAVLHLDNGEIARLTPLGVEIYGFEGDRRVKYPHLLNWSSTQVEKGGYRHYMLKEIFEQPGVVRDCLAAYFGGITPTPNCSADGSPVTLGLPAEWLQDVQQIQILACGTSWHASLVGKYLLEGLAGVPTSVQYASEFRSAPSPAGPCTLTIGVTQSGETADTLAALEVDRERRAQLAPEFQARLIGISNRPENTIGRIADYVIPTHAGIEIGVAATKTFVTQLLAFYALAIDLGVRRGTLAVDRANVLIEGLHQLPRHIEHILDKQNAKIEALAHEFSETRDFIFIGRGLNFPIALEGALKLKEISYIHAEGYPAGELKHGPIALLDDKVPVVAIATPGNVYDKVMSNAQEARARDARLIGVVAEGDALAADLFNPSISVPVTDEWLFPVLNVVPLQLLSYYIAARRGLDVDQPRNLAKSVTVE
ncbi:glutamine--fructose-6-phosphate transaminase (isomerizing) [Limnothrix sp. FACHB-881]|uniref:Glutamine--fructose-6-phosphate aminotransferase [isomerizing] n=1 Tax=Limnothrix redekei LRLZ20PSL1 TaxID=3112953 RepID=A0ABW7CB68_9CYAN|nr:glutamine--fructose-6-phosphate transaminase (isomerizing) [Limnothrix sp. FACHB-881]